MLRLSLLTIGLIVIITCYFIEIFLTCHNVGAPSGLGCAVMTAGADDPKNGRWTDVDCSATATYYGICEYDGSS